MQVFPVYLHSTWNRGVDESIDEWINDVFLIALFLEKEKAMSFAEEKRAYLEILSLNSYKEILTFNKEFDCEISDPKNTSLHVGKAMLVR
jgi:hypothetical protein